MLPVSELLNPASPPHSLSPSTLSLQDVRDQVRTVSQLLTRKEPLLAPEYVAEALNLINFYFDLGRNSTLI
jgi:hypothetical protein